MPKIAEALDCTRWSVRHWFDRYEAEGLEGLKTRPRSGRPPKVDEHYRRVLKETLETAARQLGLPFNRWTLPRLCIYTGVTISVGHMSRPLKSLGYVHKRARKVERFLGEHAGRLEPWWLAPYSPELNLIEYA